MKKFRVYVAETSARFGYRDYADDIARYDFLIDTDGNYTEFDTRDKAISFACDAARVGTVSRVIPGKYEIDITATYVEEYSADMDDWTSCDLYPSTAEIVSVASAYFEREEGEDE